MDDEDDDGTPAFVYSIQHSAFSIPPFTMTFPFPGETDVGGFRTPGVVRAGRIITKRLGKVRRSSGFSTRAV
jgi:hypothetical protein